MFKDKVELYIKAGRGGNGMVAFRREKYVEFGGPAGGDGGQGGSVIFQADESLNTLLDFTYRKHIKAGDGGHGMPKNQTGKNGEDAIYKVPLGTQVFEHDTKALIADLSVHGQTEVIAKGGKGGRGNVSFKTHKNPAPSIAENGDLGDEIHVTLELKVLADVGLVGLPNAGKSTLISSVSNAKPEIASYPFTTLNPHLGLVYVGSEKSFVMADLPGLIEGASSGIGLGFEFLRHIERCRVILHVVSMDEHDHKDPYESFLKINEELRLYKEELLERPMIIALSKMDMPGSSEMKDIFMKKLDSKYPVFDISALTRTGLDELKYALYESVEKTPKHEVEVVHRTYTMMKEGAFYTINKAEDGVYEISGEGLYKVFLRTNFNNEDAVRRFARQLNSYGITKALRDLGVKPGDEVRIFGYLFEFQE